MADRADRYALYEQAVQCVEAEIDFVDEVFEKIRRRTAVILREDFCGTANTACEWVRRRDTNMAYGVDLDRKVLDWAGKNKIARLSEDQARRIRLLNEDVLQADTGRVDAVLAMNFSYWMFKDRAGMMGYFRTVREGLNKDGVLFLDAYGGYESFQELEEETEHKGFRYVWDQYRYNPVNGESVCKIHFKFKDGSQLRDAFEYCWRIWTLPEITEMLSSCGFKPTVYWEGTDENGEGNGIYRPATTGDADAGWIAYIVAEKIAA